MMGIFRQRLRRSAPWSVVGCVLAAHWSLAVAQEHPYLDHPMEVGYDVGVPVRDGIRLSADIYRPMDDGRHPTIFQLTPYNNNSQQTMDQAWRFVQRGYAYVVVDARGRYDSEGTFYAWRDDGPDGSDVITWIAQQPWSNGTVATRGGSYSGHNQWLIGRENNPHHAAIVSYVAPADGFNDEVRWDGVPKLDLMYTWTMGMYGRVNQARAGWNWSKLMSHLPLNTMDQAAGRDMPMWQEWMEHDTLNEFWTPTQLTGFYDRFNIPSFNVTGWWDGQLRGQTQHYVNAVKTGSDSAAHMLIIGPWLHGVNRNRTIGERDFGPEAIIDLDGIRDRWLDHRMLGTAAPDLPNVMYFVQGKNEWREVEAWPVPGTRVTAYYLGSGGRANTLFGDGVLQTGRTGGGPADEFTYDPAQPVPTVSSRTSGARGGILQGSVDNRSVETREDVLVYTTEPLGEGLEVTGPVKAVVYVSADVPDTDIAVKLLDVYPDGRALNISHGIARVRYRESFEAPTLMEPGQVYEVHVNMYPTSNYFAVGHRIRIEIAGSNFPLFGRNLNTGRSSDTTTEMRVAHTRIYHSREHPSHIVLPVIPQRTAAGR